MFEVRIVGLVPLQERMARSPEKWALFLRNNLQTLGRRIAYLMRRELKPVRHTGATESSVTSQVDLGARSVSIFPQTPQSLWIRTGTRPHWAPIAPLKAWAQTKLGNENIAWAIRSGVHQHGTSVWVERKGLGDGHGGFDYPGRTLMRGDTQVAIINTARRLGADLTTYIGSAKETALGA